MYDEPAFFVPAESYGRPAEDSADGPGRFPNNWMRYTDPSFKLNYAGWVPEWPDTWQRFGASYFRFRIKINLNGTFDWKCEEANPDGKLYSWVPDTEAIAKWNGQRKRETKVVS